jgi:hypothetical protein
MTFSSPLSATFSATAPSAAKFQEILSAISNKRVLNIFTPAIPNCSEVGEILFKDAIHSDLG